MPQQDTAISWSVLSHEHRERSADWYWTLGVLTLAGAGAAVFFGNLLLALILLVGLGSIFFLAIRGPREHSVRIDNVGVTIDGTVYPYKSIDTFSITPEEPHRLILAMHSFLTPRILLALEGTSPETVRMRLQDYVEETQHEARITDSLAEIFGL